MNTLIAVLNKLKAIHFDREFRMDDQGVLLNNNSSKYYLANELEIIKTYRFEGDSNPSDSAILMILRILKTQEIGYCLSSYGASNHGEKFDAFIRALPVNRVEEQKVHDFINAKIDKKYSGSFF